MTTVRAFRSTRPPGKLAPTCGVPHVNLVVGNVQGRIGWTIMGRIPARTGEGDSRFPLRGRDQAGTFPGYFAADEAPRIVDPADGILWTANARVVDGPMLDKIGFGDYDRGCRAGMIRDRLRAIDKATEADMLSIQLDDRAVFLDRWRQLLLDLLTPEQVEHDPRRSELKRVLDHWEGRTVDRLGRLSTRLGDPAPDHPCSALTFDGPLPRGGSTVSPGRPRVRTADLGSGHAAPPFTCLTLRIATGIRCFLP